MKPMDPPPGPPPPPPARRRTSVVGIIAVIASVFFCSIPFAGALVGALGLFLHYSGRERDTSPLLSWLAVGIGVPGGLLMSFIYIAGLFAGEPVERGVIETESAVRAELAGACRAAKARGDDLVIAEFSAPWCPDCQRLDELKRGPSAAPELAKFELVKINVGEFDEHAKLREAFGVRSIAHWTVLRPSDCSAPVEQWPVALNTSMASVDEASELVAVLHRARASP